eukprot:m.302478 g.302478  ORF g.302478 m.302478 type:complete len:66 (-) comp16435_c0_seq24:2695-2892(-)
MLTGYYSLKVAFPTDTARNSRKRTDENERSFSRSNELDLDRFQCSQRTELDYNDYTLLTATEETK